MRFLDKVSPEPNTGCWFWTGGWSGRYGTFYFRGRYELAHRASWMIHNSEIPPGLEMLHKCDNTRCVNPAHLGVGTHQDNMDDMARKGRNKQPSGERQHLSKLDRPTVRHIEVILGTGVVSRIKIASAFNVSRPLIDRIANGKHWASESAS